MLIANCCLYAVQIHPKAGSTSAAFLKLGIGSRATAMGGAFAGLADDVTALYWNPAGLGRLKNSELHLTHNELFENIRHDFAAYNFRKWNGTVGVAMYGLYMPSDIERRAGLNEADPYEPISPVEGLFTAYDMAVHVAYGREYRENWYVGAGLKLIRQTIDTESAYGAAVDLGVLHNFAGTPLSAGFMLQHIGTPIKFINTGYDLPINMKLGAAYKWTDKLVTTLDLNQPNDNYLFISAGTEYNLLRFMLLRAGYRYRMNGLELGDLSGLSAGVGFIFPMADSRMRFDYAFLPYGVLGNSHRVSIGIEFGHFSEGNASIPGRKIGETTSKPPVTPAPPPPVQVEQPQTDPFEGFTMHSSKLNSSLKTGNNRLSVYSITIEPSGGDVAAIKALLRARSAEELALDVGERGRDAGKTYKDYRFRTNSPAPFQKAAVTLKLPKQLLEPKAALRKNGARVRLEKASEDGDHIIYILKLDELQDFSIISE